MSFSFSPENETKFEHLRTRYPSLRALMLPVLWMVQEQEGWISPEAMEYLAQKLSITPTEVYSVASFYTMFHFKPIGTHHIQVCKTLSCMLGGSESILAYLQKTLGITCGQTTPDGRFTLTQVECLGACGGAPCVCIDTTYYEKVSEATLSALLEELRS